MSNSNSVNIPKYYSHGPRKLNIVLTQFRCSATFLNYDLFKVNIISNPSCNCGAIREDAYHYFFEFPLYNGIRNDPLNCLDWLPNDCHLDLNLLIVGNSTFANQQNEFVLKKVFDYIRDSARSWLFNVHLNKKKKKIHIHSIIVLLSMLSMFFIILTLLLTFFFLSIFYYLYFPFYFKILV